MSEKVCGLKPGEKCLAVAELEKTVKDYKELIRTLQKEAEKCEGRLKKSNELYEASEAGALKERKAHSETLTNLAQVNKKHNQAEQKAVLWANQYFEFMQKAIEQSAVAMTQQPQAHPMGGGIKK